MNFHRLLLKTAYWLVAISIVILIALTFFSRHIVNKQSKTNTATFVNTPADNDTKIEISGSGMSITIDDSIAKKEVEEIKKAIEKDDESKADQNR